MGKFQINSVHHVLRLHHLLGTTNGLSSDPVQVFELIGILNYCG